MGDFDLSDIARYSKLWKLPKEVAVQLKTSEKIVAMPPPFFLP